MIGLTSTATAQDYPDDCMDALEIPSSFSPNADGNNDTWHIDFPCPPEDFEIKIFNRWGVQVYERNDFPTSDETVGWDGRFKGELLDTGVYVFLLEMEFINGSVRRYSGDVTLLR